tara:strand:- start:1300 stop:1515 length:216 start_codon:yes stop_codon:yes gene_type:complete
MKYKITGTYEVIFDTKDLTQFSESEMTVSEEDELFMEWKYDGTQIIEEQLVPCLKADSVKLIEFDVERKQQ